MILRGFVLLFLLFFFFVRHLNKICHSQRNSTDTLAYYLAVLIRLGIHILNFDPTFAGLKAKHNNNLTCAAVSSSSSSLSFSNLGSNRLYIFFKRKLHSRNNQNELKKKKVLRNFAWSAES
jgi:hypothetical protein